MTAGCSPPWGGPTPGSPALLGAPAGSPAQLEHLLRPRQHLGLERKARPDTGLAPSAQRGRGGLGAQALSSPRPGTPRAPHPEPWAAGSLGPGGPDPWPAVVGKRRRTEPRCDGGVGVWSVSPGQVGTLCGEQPPGGGNGPPTAPLCALAAPPLLVPGRWPLSAQLPARSAPSLGSEVRLQGCPWPSYLGWAGPGLGEGAVTPASPSCTTSLPQSQSEQAVAPSGGAGRTWEG